MRHSLIAVIVLLVSSCATLSKDQCESTNWFEKGKTDGMAGAPASRWEKYQGQCKKHGLHLADDQNYFAGRNEGLTIFCTFENGVNFGDRGNWYEGVCPKETEAAFLKGYRIGEKQYDLRKREKELADREAKLKQKEREEEERARKARCIFDSDCKSGMNGHCSFGVCKYN